MWASIVGISRTENEYSNLKLGNVNGKINVLTKKSVSTEVPKGK